jgi:hypothetical protein
MSFEDACQKETWFFDTLFKVDTSTGDDETRRLCGINNLRDKLVDTYAQLVARQMQRAAPVIFRNIVEHKETIMVRKWGWEFTLESFENPYQMLTEVAKTIRELIDAARQSGLPTARHKILLREDVNAVFDQCRALVAAKLADDKLLENCKRYLKSLVRDIWKEFIEQVQNIVVSTQRLGRLTKLCEHVVKMLTVLAKICLKKVDTYVTDFISSEELNDSAMPPHTKIELLLNECAQEMLVDVGNIFEGLPNLPAQDLNRLEQLPECLAYADVSTKLRAEIEQPFGFQCDERGKVIMVTDPIRCKIPHGAIICQVQTKNDHAAVDYSDQHMKKIAGVEGPVKFTYQPITCPIIGNDKTLAKWLYHKDDVSHEYLEDRENFLQYIRAGDLLCSVFQEQTSMIPERGTFESIGVKILDVSEYRGQKLVVPPLTGGAQFVLAGECCSEGCLEKVDTAFNPCGHTVCCWKCSHRHKICPVCCGDLTSTGIREARQLCFDEFEDRRMRDAVREQRLIDAREYDHIQRQKTESEYQQLFDSVQQPDIVVGAYAAARELQQLWHERLKKIQTKNGEPPLLGIQVPTVPKTPTYMQLSNVDTYTTLSLLAICEQRLREAQDKAAEELQQEKARAAGELQQAQDRAVRELQQEQARAAGELQQAEDRAARELEQQVAAVKASARQQLQEMSEQRDVRKKRKDWKPDAGAPHCTRPGCGAVFGVTTRKHHCRACGKIFCNACSAQRFTFDTPEGKTPGRVCGACHAELHGSRGMRCSTSF